VLALGVITCGVCEQEFTAETDPDTDTDTEDR